MCKTLTILSFLLICSCFSTAQTRYRVMSYNVENLFDTNKSTDKNDNEFLPAGKRFWTKGRYYHKLQQIAKVISAAGEWDTPALVGLCEVENASVLNDLLARTPLQKQDYRYCITTGADVRGINTALLYQRDKFQYLYHSEYPVLFANPQKKSRNILHVTGKIVSNDTLDILVCHFPSRYGGEKETIRDRNDAAGYLHVLCDSIYKCRQNCFILIMGDFNDNPDDESLVSYLKAMPSEDIITENSSGIYLINLFFQKKGSHKYQDTWSQLDQIIINSNLHKNLIPGSPKIFSPPFLLIKDKVWHGYRPFRTYHGYKYERGFSDHLPVIADFNL